MTRCSLQTRAATFFNVMLFILALFILAFLAGCTTGSYEPAPPVAQPDTTGWPRDHCGELYQPGTQPINEPGQTCK